jgi:dipeptidyl aminopeptidase/acylaminoacyl peptidase
MNSDVTVDEAAHLWAPPDGRSILFSAPVDGSFELWRIATADGSLTRLTEDQHHISGWHAVPGDRPGSWSKARIAYLRSSPTETPDLWFQVGAGKPHRASSFNDDVLKELALVQPVERRSEVDGRAIQGWFMPPADRPDGAGGTSRGERTTAAPVVTEIHGGPHTLYGWAPMFEFQILAANGMGVFYCNPRGSEGYGQAFNGLNHRDWGPGPMRDVLAGVDALVADGLADPKRLGLTGGSYGGYLTNWIIGHDDRFATAMTCRSVSDMSMLFLTGDISSGEWATMEFDATPWDDPAYYREISPLSYAADIRTPLLIQHSERDIRTTIGQAEALFTVLRSYRRPVRLLRVPEETHELTRSGTPYRRVENLNIVRDWFAHFLIAGRRRLPPLPKVRGGR